MSQSFLMPVFLSVLALSLSLGSAMSQDAAKDKEAAEKFATLKSKLPETVRKAMMEEMLQILNDAKKVSVALELARRTGPTEGKITIRISVTRPAAETQVAFLVIYLSYFEGHWTSTRVEGWWLSLGGERRLNGMLMLAIDKITEE